MNPQPMKYKYRIVINFRGFPLPQEILSTHLHSWIDHLDTAFSVSSVSIEKL